MNHKLNKMTKPSFKRMTISAVSLLVLTAGAQFSYADVAAQPEKTASVPAAPATAALQTAVKVTTKAFNEKTDNYTATLQIPVISGLLDKNYQAQLNNIISRQAMADFAVLRNKLMKMPFPLQKTPMPDMSLILTM